MTFVYRRIHVSGAAGSGKSTVAAALAERWDALHVDADALMWLPSDPPFAKRRDPDERDRMFLDAVDGAERWVFSRSLLRWGERLTPLFDLVVYLDLPADVRLARLEARERARHGAAIEPGGVLHGSHRSLMTLQSGYESGETPVANRANALAWLAGLACPVIRIEGAPTLEESLAIVERA
ncbi:MAG TPA: AAA family ATPase [Caulobacteraceae bacterium]|nr:AAA family ATPase [Caulobacteraceae bacterium]